MSEISGESTSTVPLRILAGTWKVSDLPAPVGITPMQSCPASTASMMVRCPGRNSRKPKIASSTCWGSSNFWEWKSGAVDSSKTSLHGRDAGREVRTESSTNAPGRIRRRRVRDASPSERRARNASRAAHCPRPRAGPAPSALALGAQDLLEDRQCAIGIAATHRLDRLPSYFGLGMVARDVAELVHDVLALEPAEALDRLALDVGIRMVVREVEQEIGGAGTPADHLDRHALHIRAGMRLRDLLEPFRDLRTLAPAHRLDRHHL